MKNMPAYFKRLFVFQLAIACLALLAGLLYTPRAQAGQDTVRVLVMGDSLSAEYGIARGDGWVQLLSNQWQSTKPPVAFINASISGETTIGGRTRLPPLLAQHHPDIVIIELGANDALRGLDVKNTQNNLDTMVQACLQAKARVLIIGMQVPPNYGKRYTEDFAKVFAAVATKNKTALMPFLLKDVADRPDSKEWFQADGLHPLAKAHPLIAKNIESALKPLFLGR